MTLPLYNKLSNTTGHLLWLIVPCHERRISSLYLKIFASDTQLGGISYRAFIAIPLLLHLMTCRT